MIPNPAYPYVRTSPRLRSGTTRTLASTASSSTLNSQSSCGSGSRIPRLRRSLSSISNSSESYIQQPGADPRVHRIKRAESFAGSALYPPGSPLKCAPSFGVISKRSSDAMSVDHSNRSDVTTSDEEEKLRSKKAKKPRVKASSPTPPATSPTTSPTKPKQLRRTTKQIIKHSSAASMDCPHRSSRPKTDTKCPNSHLFGPELPTPTPHISSLRYIPHACGPAPQTPAPSSAPRKTPRRTRGPSGRAPVGRKISFGSLVAPQEAENAGFGAGLGLGSAFQLD